MSGENLSTFINKVLKGMHFENRASLVLDLVFTGEMFGEAGKVASKHFVCQQVQKTITAWRLCKAKDTAHQGCLNLQGIEAVCQAEELEKGEEGMIHSKSAIWREGNKLLKKVGYPMFLPTDKDEELGKVLCVILKK